MKDATINTSSPTSVSPPNAPDVLSYQTEPMTEAMTVTGRLKADVFLSSTGTDADLIVKLIDVLPGKEEGIATSRGRRATNAW